MIKCKDLVKTLSSEEPLSFRKKAEIKLHLLMCIHCSNYTKHLKILADGIRRAIVQKMKADERDISEVKKATLEKIRK